MYQSEQICADNFINATDKYVIESLIDIINNVFAVNIDKSKIFNNDYLYEIESQASGYVYTIRIYYNQIYGTRNIEIYKFSKIVFKFTAAYTSENVQYDINVDNYGEYDKSILSILNIISDTECGTIHEPNTQEGDNK
jgi:hypothetical protein